METDNIMLFLSFVPVKNETSLLWGSENNWLCGSTFCTQMSECLVEQMAMIRKHCCVNEPFGN